MEGGSGKARYRYDNFQIKRLFFYNFSSSLSAVSSFLNVTYACICHITLLFLPPLILTVRIASESMGVNFVAGLDTILAAVIGFVVFMSSLSLIYFSIVMPYVVSSVRDIEVSAFCRGRWYPCLKSFILRYMYLILLLKVIGNRIRFFLKFGKYILWIVLFYYLYTTKSLKVSGFLSINWPFLHDKSYSTVQNLEYNHVTFIKIVYMVIGGIILITNYS